MEPKLRQAVHELIADRPGVVRRGALKVDYKKMCDWRTRGGVVFAYEHEYGHLWVLDDDELRELTSDIPNEPYPASDLWRDIGADGKPRYGRHSGLARIPELRDADLIRFTPGSIAHAVRILARLDRSP